MKYDANSPETSMIRQLNHAAYVKRVEAEMAAYRPACLSSKSYVVEMFQDGEWSQLESSDSVEEAASTFEDAVALMGISGLRLIGADGETLATCGG